MIIPSIVLSLALGVGAASTPPGVQEAKAPAQSGPASEQVEALKREYSDAQDAFFKALRALPEQEQGPYYNAHKLDVDSFTKRFRALADANPKTPAAAQALEWIVQNNSSAPASQAALEKLLEDHAASAELGRACLRLRYSDDAQVERLLERARKESPSAAVRGQATFALAQYYLRAAERPPAAELQNGGASSNRSDLGPRAEALLEEVVHTYADQELNSNRKLGDAAQAALFERRALAIGKVAPDIEGEDLDGAKIKLSDYRGKVVVLDFWGNW
jgi:hypothetical protein